MLEPTTAAPGAAFPPQEESSELREYLAVLRGRKWSIVAITALTLMAALFFSFRQTPIYESESQVLVHPVPASGSQTVLAPVPNLDTERTVATSREVAELAAQRLGGAVDPDDLLEDLSVEVATNSEVLVIRYAHPSPLEAQRRSGAFARAYVEFRQQQTLQRVIAVQEGIQQQLNRVRGQLRELIERIEATQDEIERADLESQQSQREAQIAVLEQERSEAASITQIPVADIIAQADLPSSPASPNHILNGALALLVGLALGVGLAFLRERLDDRLRGQADLEARAGAPVLAVVPRIPNWKKAGDTPLVAVTDPKSGAAEAYRTLRTSLLFAAAERDLKVIMITSPHPGEGKTATTANLAAVLAQAGRRVVAISADLRKPRLHRFFGASNSTGLSRLLTGEDGFREAVQKVRVQNLRLVSSGPVPKNPAELVGSHAMAKALERFRDAADLVLIDAAPVLDVADTMTMAPFVDAVVLVADAEKTSRGALSHARKQLDQVKADVIGAVLNNLDPSRARAYPYYYRYYYRYYYEYGDREQSRDRRRGRRAAAPEEPPSAPPAWEEWTWEQTPAPPAPRAKPAEPRPAEPRTAPEPAAATTAPERDSPVPQAAVPPPGAGPDESVPPITVDVPLPPRPASAEAQPPAEAPVAEGTPAESAPAEASARADQPLERIWSPNRRPPAEIENGSYTPGEASFFSTSSRVPSTEQESDRAPAEPGTDDAAAVPPDPAERSTESPRPPQDTTPTDHR